MDASSALPLIAFFISLLLPSSSLSFSNVNGIGFSARLLHHNSVGSPFYNPNLTQSDRIQAAIQNTLSRRRYFQSLINSKRASPDEIQPRIRSQGPEYIMTYYIGTPPTETFAFADTGSDLIWLQCLPCEECYKQKIPLFDPTKSSSYESITCDDTKCSLFSTVRCDDNRKCHYGVVYSDSASSDGILSIETLIFEYDRPPNITLTNMIFGCGHKNVEVFQGDDNIPGVLGLNRNPLSFVSQLDEHAFSYCFVPKHREDVDSLMHFGLSAVISGKTTPILKDADGRGLYYLSLEGISVDNEKLPIPSGTFNVTRDGDGGFVIDSGTTLTLLANEALDLLIDAVAKKMSIKRVEDPFRELNLCYEAAYSDILKAPYITFHFTGVDVVLDAIRAWVDTGNKGIYCLAMIMTEGTSIFGNHQQQNLNVGYDLGNNVVSFEEKDCTEP